MDSSYADAISSVCASAFNAVAAAWPYWGIFLCSLGLSLALTPLCRALSRRLGMVDMPGPRRINKCPIPRGGGLAVFFAVALSAAALMALSVPAGLSSEPYAERAAAIFALAAALVAIGYADDKWSLPPWLKFLGQTAVAFLSWRFAGLSLLGGFFHVPAAEISSSLWITAADAFLTVFWIDGAVNAFNLIDGLDGLASGLGAIASLGMAGAILFSAGNPATMLPYLALAGACIGFLRYNFNPASVFLGDSGSMFIGYMLGGLPLAAASGESLFVSLGVPVLLMGVPFFDTFLAVVRRSLRALIHREECGAAGDGIMKADSDHLHHRILRRFHGSQKAAARVLYGFAIFLVAVAMGGIWLKDRASALFIVAFLVAVVVVVRDLMRVELFDTGRLVTDIVFSRNSRRSRMRMILETPLSVAFDLAAMCGAWMLANKLVHLPMDVAMMRKMPLFVMPTFLAMAAAGVYRIVWPRAQSTDFARLLFSVLGGTGVSASVSIICNHFVPHLATLSFLYAGLAFFPMAGMRVFRAIARDSFFALERMRLSGDKSAERILVYGAGLRFRAFRRELVRSFGRNRRIIVGLIDDAPALRRRMVSGIPVLGSIASAASIIRDFRVQSVVIAAEMPEHRLAAAVRRLSRLGVNVSLWSCRETPLDPPAPAGGRKDSANG